MSSSMDTDPPLSSLVFSLASRPPPLHAIDSRTKPHHYISNRLHSIAKDADFVRRLAEAYQLPVVANERCGSWYVPPDIKQGSVYFKSTDGHFGQWSFSLRRLNVGLLDLIGNAGGCIIVDSTRRGKHMSDALLKTVPIWCTVMNKLLFPEEPQFHRFPQFSQIISQSECSQIDTRLDTFLAQLQNLELNTNELRSRIRKPMSVRWITRSLETPICEGNTSFETEQSTQIVLCMASEFEPDAKPADEDYIQGAGDDSESWACGLSPEQFWHNSSELLDQPEEQIKQAIYKITSNAKIQTTEQSFDLLVASSRIYVGAIAALSKNVQEHDAIILCTENMSEGLHIKPSGRCLVLNCRPGKLGSKDLRQQLSHVPRFIRSRWPWHRLLVCCETGKDLSVGVALTVICLFVDINGGFQINDDTEPLDKTFIRKKLGAIMVQAPHLNPSRATMNAVNSYLIKQ